MTNDLDREPSTDEPGAGITVWRILGIAAFLVIAAWWIYVFANGSSVDHPDDFDDATERLLAVAGDVTATAREEAKDAGWRG